MVEDGSRILREADTFAAIEFLHQQADSAAVMETYASLVKELYGSARDVPAMLAMGRAGIQYGLDRAAAIEDDDADAATFLRSRAKAIAYNLAANTWPGWNDPGVEITATDMALGLDAAKTNLRLAMILEKGDLPLSRAYWVLGAHHLAAGQFALALESFQAAAHHADRSGAAEEALLARGYVAVTRLLRDPANGQSLAELSSIKAQLASTEHGPFFIDQLDTAQNVLRPWLDSVLASGQDPAPAQNRHG